MKSPTLPSFPWRLAHLAALWAYGVAQPTFSMLQGNPEFLVVRGSTRLDVLAFALILLLGPPLLVVALQALVARLPGTLDGAIHLVALWAFGTLAILQLTRLLDLRSGASLLLPVVPALVLAVAYLRWPLVRTFLSVSLALPAIGLVAFVATVPLAIDDAEAADVQVSSDVPVVLVVFDELPVSSLLTAAGKIDGVRYPTFGRLAREATWYPRATTPHDYTTQAVPSLLTGRLPRRGALPTLADHPENLFTLLGGAYDLHVQEQVTHLCPSRSCPSTRSEVPLLDRQRGLFYDASAGYLHRTLPRALRTELPPIGERWGGFGDGDEPDARERVLGALNVEAFGIVAAHAEGHKRDEFERFLRAVDEGRGGRTLYFLHSILPHSPWRYLPSGRRYGNSTAIEGIHRDWQTWAERPELVRQSLQRHLLQLGYTDRLLGGLVGRLDRSGLWDSSLVIVTADHGASFRPGGGMRLASEGNLADIASVPLFVKYPGQRTGRADGRDAHLTDVLPTIADVVGVELPWSVDGRSLLRQPVRREVRVATQGGKSVSAPPDAVHRAVLQTARRTAALFGEGHTSLYRLGPHVELLGRAVDRLDWRAGEGTSVRLAEREAFADVDLRSGSLPVHVVGEIESPDAKTGRDVAIAVNGRIAAVTRSSPWAGDERFSSLVPETAFRNGRNVVDVFAVDRRGSSLRLVRLGGTLG